MNNWWQKKQNSGFTIIEVMIVLAVAGLIMVIVFIAVPQLQRSQRDSARQSIANRVESDLESYARNNNGVYPLVASPQTNINGATCDAATSGCWENFVTKYIQGHTNVTDPSTGAPDIDSSTMVPTHGLPQAYNASGNTLPGAPGELAIIYGAKCSDESVTASGTTDNRSVNLAVVIGLDRTSTDYCVDNQ